MNVFFSWSGDRSRAVAAIFNEWLPEAIQAVVPFFSPEIPKGTAWFNEIATRLESFSFGILFVTRDDITAPWMMFEAGALFKHFGQAKVCPLLFDDLTPGELQGALPNLNVTRFGISEDFNRLLKTINASLPNPLRDDVLQRTFDRIYPELVQKVNAALEENEQPKIDKSPERELLEKILSEVQSGFAQSNLPARNQATYTMRLGDDIVETRSDRDRRMEEVIARNWHTLTTRMFDELNIPLLPDGKPVDARNNPQLPQFSDVANALAKAPSIRIERGRVFILVDQDVDVHELSEKGLQAAAVAIGAMHEPPTRARRLYVQKIGGGDSRHVYPHWMEEIDRKIEANRKQEE